MKRIRHMARYMIWNGVIWGCVFFLSSGRAFAAEEAGNWRAIYDVVMIWVNFFILAFLVIKFAGPFLKKFLKDRQNEVAVEIEQLEHQRNQLLKKLEKAVERKEESVAHFKMVKDRIIAQGEAEKEAIIEDARCQSKAMIDDARRRIENQILNAKQNFRSELIDAAAELAMENIGGHLTAEDNDRFLQQFMAAASQ